MLLAEAEVRILLYLFISLAGINHSKWFIYHWSTVDSSSEIQVIYNIDCAVKALFMHISNLSCVWHLTLEKIMCFDNMHGIADHLSRILLYIPMQTSVCIYMYLWGATLCTFFSFKWFSLGNWILISKTFFPLFVLSRFSAYGIFMERVGIQWRACMTCSAICKNVVQIAKKDLYHRYSE